MTWDTGEVMRVTGMRSGRTRDVWRIPTAYRWRAKWGFLPWRVACEWSFGGEVAAVPDKPHPKAVVRAETEQFIDIERRPA